MKKLLCLSPILLLFACASTQTNTDKAPKIEGNWRWIETTGGFAGITKTPENSSDIKHLQITKDSVFAYDRGELQYAQAYKLTLAQSQLSNKTEWLLHEDPMRTFISRQDSVLVLKEDCFDCFTHKYVKMREK